MSIEPQALIPILPCRSKKKQENFKFWLKLKICRSEFGAQGQKVGPTPQHNCFPTDIRVCFQGKSIMMQNMNWLEAKVPSAKLNVVRHFFFHFLNRTFRRSF